MGIAFENASTIFLDPRMISVFDTEHSEDEDSWATIGIDKNGILLVVVHTFSSWPPTLTELELVLLVRQQNRVKQYKEENK